jgi:hypothetical protein
MQTTEQPAVTFTERSEQAIRLEIARVIAEMKRYRALHVGLLSQDAERRLDVLWEELRAAKCRDYWGRVNGTKPYA